MTSEGVAEAHRSAVVCALLGVVGTTLGVFGFWAISGTPLRAAQATGILINGAGLWVLARRGRQTLRRAQVIFLLVLVPTTVMTWLVDDARAMYGVHWVPYEPAKLSALTIAVIAPPGWWAGLIGIAMFVGSALVHHAVMPPDFRVRMSSGEPFGIIAYGVFALVLLVFKQRGFAMHEELQRARSEKMVLTRVARVAMAMRDLANTPIQTLELVRQSLLLLDGPERRSDAERMGRALERLRRLNDILLPYQASVTAEDSGVGFEGEVLAAQARMSPPPKSGASPSDAETSPAPRARHRPG